MALEYGKKYSKMTLSGYKTQEEAVEWVERAYAIKIAEVREKKDGYVVYIEDEKGEEYRGGVDVDVVLATSVPF